MALLGRVMSALQGAWSGAVAGWQDSGNNAADFSDWDTFPARAQRYVNNTDYYNNRVYDTLASQSGALKTRQSLYRWIRGVHNPVARLVDLYPAKVYGGSLDLETGTTGAIPLVCKPPLAEAIIALWKTSNWGTEKTTFVWRGAMLGDTFIKLVNDASEQYVCMETLHPGKVNEWRKDASGSIIFMAIEYDVYEDTTATNTRYRYREEITPDGFATFKDGKPFAYYEQGATWENPYGFVPVVHAQHHNLGLDSGASCFHTSRQKIDELNNAASLLNDQIAKVINPVWFATGGQRADIDLSQSARDSIPIVYGKTGATMTALVNNLDIVGARANIDSLIKEVEKDMPELTLYELRAQGLASGVAVKRMYEDAVNRIKGASGSYDAALAMAQSMGVAMGAYHRYAGYEGFRLEDFKRGNLYHVIKERSAFDETLDKQARIAALAQVKDQPPALARLTLRELDFDEATIEEVLAEMAEGAAQDAAAAARAFGKSMFGEDENGAQDNPDESTEGAQDTRYTANTRKAQTRAETASANAR